MVLATDMKQHFTIHSMFQAKMHLNGNRSSTSSGGHKHLLAFFVGGVGVWVYVWVGAGMGVGVGVCVGGVGVSGCECTCRSVGRWM